MLYLEYIFTWISPSTNKANRLHTFEAGVIRSACTTSYYINFSILLQALIMLTRLLVKPIARDPRWRAAAVLRNPRRGFVQPSSVDRAQLVNPSTSTQVIQEGHITPQEGRVTVIDSPECTLH